MGRMGMLAVISGFVAVVVVGDSAHAALTAAQRRELARVRRELLKVPGLLRRRKVVEARKIVDDAEARLRKLIGSSKPLARDRTVQGIVRLWRIQKRRLPKGAGKTAGKTPVAHAPGSPRRKLTIPVGGKSPFQVRYEAARKVERVQATRDLAYWGRMLRGKPSAEDKQRALFHVAAINIRMGNWDAAQGPLEALVKEFPKGEWTVAAKCRLIDLKIEHAFDLTWPLRELRILMVWADTKDMQYVAAAKVAAKAKAKGPEKRPAKGNSDSVPARRTPKPQPKKSSAKKKEAVVVPSFVLKPNSEKQNVAAIFRRAALLDFLRGEVKPATRVHLLRAQQYAGAPKSAIPTDRALYQCLLPQVMSRRPSTPRELWQSARGMYPHLLFGDLLLAARAFERARDHASSLLAHQTLRFTDLQKSYLHFQNGRAANALRDAKLRRKAAGDFESAVKLAPKARWADRCLFLAANARWNHEHAGQQAIALWQRLMKDYPQSREWDRSAYYVGVIHQQEKRYADAKAAWESLLKERPKTSFAKLTKEKLKAVERELSR